MTEVLLVADRSRKGVPEALEEVRRVVGAHGRIVEELDQDGPGSGDIEVRIYKLENGNAREVSNVLQQLLQQIVASFVALTVQHRREGIQPFPGFLLVGVHCAKRRVGVRRCGHLVSC